jgi:hypothetical protein
MTQKSIGVIIAITGLVLVLGYLFFRYDLKRASESGPRWKRRLVCAGILVLSMMGIVSCAQEEKIKDDAGAVSPAVTGAPTVAAIGNELAESPEYKKVLAIFEEAKPYAGSRVSFEEDRVVIEKKLNEIPGLSDKLFSRGLISAEEAGLLKSEVERVIHLVYSEPPFGVMCYMKDFPPIAEKSIKEISSRLPLLIKLVESGKVHPAVIEKILPSILKDLIILSTKSELDKLSKAEREKAEVLYKEGVMVVEKLNILVKEVENKR